MSPTQPADYLVVLDVSPPSDIPAAAAAWVQALGGTSMDHARHLRGCRGIAAERLDKPSADKLAAALTAAGTRAWSVAAQLLPPLPRPLTASRLDPTDPDKLELQIALTGPPDAIAWRQIVLMLPARRTETRKTVTVKPKKSVGIGTVALAASTGIGAGKVLSAMRNKSEPGKVDIDTTSRALVEIVAVAPLRRVHAYADRLDYSVLGDEREQGKGNFAKLLAKMRERARPELAGHAALDRFIADGSLPGMLIVQDNNELAAIARWLLLRAAAQRIAR